MGTVTRVEGLGKVALRLLIITLLASGTVGYPLSTSAHEIRPGLLQVTQTSPSNYQIVWKQPLLGDRRLPLDPVLEPACPKTQSQTTTTSGAIVERWQTQCELSSIRIDGLERTLTDVMLQYADGSGREERALLRPERTGYELGNNSDNSALLYAQLGIEHLVFGYDHVLFVLALLLLISSTRTLLITVTCFTVAHSITLALSVLGWVQLAQSPIEACIALSIVVLAYEALRQRASPLGRSPWLAAFGFGLLHGFGFAGALRDIGLPHEDLWVALLSFNVGIELGQLAMIGLWVVAINLISRIWASSTQADLAGAYVARLTAYAIGTIAMYWTLQRAIPIIASAVQL